MKQLFYILTLISLFSNFCLAQNQREEFIKYVRNGNTEKQLEVLQQWEKENPKDAELYTCYFNYYFLQSKQSGITLTTDSPDSESLALKDSTGGTTGYLVEKTFYDKVNIDKAFEYIDQGIKEYPNRLDMRFGKIHTLGQIEDWEIFTQEIIAAIQQSNKNDNQWTWTYHKEFKGGKNGFLASIQDYQLMLYDTRKDSLLNNMIAIGNEVLKYYPNHVESLSNVSLSYILLQKNEKALPFLLKAEKLAPQDVVILNNLAEYYKRTSDIEMAISYYQKIVAHGDPNSAKYAEDQIEKLKKG